MLRPRAGLLSIILKVMLIRRHPPSLSRGINTPSSRLPCFLNQLSLCSDFLTTIAFAQDIANAKLRFMYTVWLHVFFILLLVITLYNYLLQPSPLNQWSLIVATYASPFVTETMTLQLSFTEWVKTRFFNFVAGTKHRLHGRDKSTSCLLLLPPEIRLQIWEELIPRIKGERGYTGVNVQVFSIRPQNWSGGIGDCLHYVPLSAYQIETIIHPRIPVAFLRTCRQIHEEGHQFYFGTSTFCFHDPQTLYNFVNALSLPQQRTIRHIKYNADEGSMVHPELHFDDTWRYISIRAAQVPSITEKLQDLRTFDIDTGVPANAEFLAHYAHSIHQLLRFVKASEKLTVYLDLRSKDRHCCYKIWKFGWMSQEKFAMDAWKLIHNPHAHMQSLVARPGELFKSKYIIEAQILE